MAAAMPPSAMTVWALPSSDLHTRATWQPCAAASIAARSPAPPAPTTTTSNSWVSYSAMVLEHPQVGDRPVGDQADVQISEGDHEEAHPRVQHVSLVEDGAPAPQPVAQRVLGEAVEVPAAEVAAGVARQRVDPQHRGVGQQHQRAHSQAEAVWEGEPPDRVPGVAAREGEHEVEEVAVDVLQDQRESRLAAVAPPGVGDGAGGRRPPER